MKKHEKNEHVKLAATTALLNSLEFTRANFEKENERNYIMQVVCEATQSPNTKIKVSALQCLVKIMSLYYRYMEAYMGPALFAVSVGGCLLVQEKFLLNRMISSFSSDPKKSKLV